MATPDQFGIDPGAFAELESVAHSVTHHTDARKFSSTATGMFGEIVYVELSGSPKTTGLETPAEAHARLQKERGAHR